MRTKDLLAIMSITNALVALICLFQPDISDDFFYIVAISSSISASMFGTYWSRIRRNELKRKIRDRK